ncbi:MAG: hypothetical protein IPK56_10005 [Elusimicrobia bacterium]|nr:hypothetical protein [Elusimicrobiota bacterium]
MDVELGRQGGGALLGVTGQARRGPLPQARVGGVAHQGHEHADAPLAHVFQQFFGGGLAIRRVGRQVVHEDIQQFLEDVLQGGRRFGPAAFQIGGLGFGVLAQQAERPLRRAEGL